MQDDIGKRAATLGELRRGWPTLLGCTLGVAVGMAGLPFYTTGVFVHSLQADFGWTRGQLSAASFAALFTVVLSAPIAGVAIDRWGVRLPMAFSMAGLALGLVALATMSGNYAQYLLIEIVMFAVAIGSTPVSFTRSVNERFDAGRGLALGLTLSGTGIAAFFGPPAVAAIIATHGWRSAYFQMATLVALAVPVIFFLLGARPMQASAPATNVRTEAGEKPARLALSVMVADSRYLRLLIIFFFLALGVSGFVLHLIPLLTDAGVPAIEAAGIQARLGLAVIVGRLAVGAAVDHFFAPRVAALSLCLTIAGIVALAIIGPSVAPLSALAIGFALGAEVDLIGYLTVRYFGLGHYGRRYGVLYAAFVLGTGFSPVLIATIAAHAGGYRPALWTCAGMVTIAVLFLATAPRFIDTSKGDA
ncbi:MAG: major Facilitator Superfamily protein [Bradyrhizobium sp.]|nr:major Facilitator Superfamily protein [Bradyrhizobium sp.]